MTPPLPPTGNGKKTAQAVPLIVLVPQGVFQPRFQVVAQWHTGTGIMCLPQRVPIQPLSPAMIIQLFIGLVNQGLVHQVIRDEGKDPVAAPLPPVELVFGALAKQEDVTPTEAPTPTPDDLEKKWGEGVS